MSRTTPPKRDMEILQLFRKTNNKAVVGRAFGLSRERVRQIVEKYQNEDLTKLDWGI